MLLGQIRCGTINQPSPQLLDPANNQVRSVMVIPVVFHVLYRNQLDSISDERIYSQVDVLNTDYRAINSDQSSLPEKFRDLLADMEIEFCLAGIDPAGNPTNGIIRKKVNIDGIGSASTADNPPRSLIKYDVLGGSDGWDPTIYLNIWIGSFDNSTPILAEAKFPWENNPKEDGIRIDPDYVGINCINPLNKQYGLGRTLTHEIGHYLGLLHPWGPGCDDDDQVADTPDQRLAWGGCPINPLDPCGEDIMFQNFMQFTDDDCMSLFTKGQKERVDAIINQYRPTLLNQSISCYEYRTAKTIEANQWKIFPVPALNCLMLENKLQVSEEVELKIVNMSGIVLKQYKIEIEALRPIDLSSISPGVYFLEISGKEGRIRTRFIKL
jgi:hypothetical protein